MAAGEKKNQTAVAVIFGVTGLVGKELAKRLLSLPEWKVYGVARLPDFKPIADPNFEFLACDLLNPIETKKKLSLLKDATHLFWITWASQFPFDSSHCCILNKAMMFNALSSILPVAAALRHVSLQTGTKHYAPKTDVSAFREDDPRSEAGNNFYYVLEDLLREKLAGGKVTWSVLRPGLIFGSSNRTFFNFIGSICVYAAICKKLNRPFVFGGSKHCWEKVYINGSDARTVADQHIWVAMNEKIATSAGEFFNAVNKTSFTWKKTWAAVGKELFGSAQKTVFSSEFFYAKAMAGKEKVWREIVEEEGLVETKMEDLANWEFMDSLFRCPVKMVASCEKAERFGFFANHNTLDSILYWIDVMRNDKLIPFS